MNYSCALVTGASSGLGEEFARQLATDSGTLVLVARRRERLEALAADLLKIAPQLQVAIFVKDLCREEDRLSLREECVAQGLEPDFLVNNAGRGDYGDFSAADWETTRQMMTLNMEAVTHLTHLFLPGLMRQRGALLNVSSLAGDMPIPDFAVYAATKAFVSSFTDAIRIELREAGVSVTALCPGPIKTEFGEQARRGDEGKLPVQESFYVRAEDAVFGALAAVRRDRPRHYPGWKVAAAAVVIGVLPLFALRGVMAKRPRRAK